jgi:hypothetical protein
MSEGRRRTAAGHGVGIRQTIEQRRSHRRLGDETSQGANHPRLGLVGGLLKPLKQLGGCCRTDAQNGSFGGACRLFPPEHLDEGA